MNQGWLRFKPAVDKSILIFLSGILWVAVASMLLAFAVGWLRVGPMAQTSVLATTGIIAALIIHHFGFLRVVDKNLGRIVPGDEKRCIFAFQSWRSYLIIVSMMGMGFVLRNSSLPKPYLAVLYIAIGSALILSSVRYLRVWLSEK